MIYITYIYIIYIYIYITYIYIYIFFLLRNYFAAISLASSSCTGEATEMAAKYLLNKKMCF